MPTETREQWLLLAVEKLIPWFESHNYRVPALRVSCGWPSKSALAAKRRSIGECWPKEAASDKVTQIFISPYLEDQLSIVSTLVHEVVHAVVGCDKKHGKIFGQCARAVGLEGKLTSTNAGEALTTEIQRWCQDLGTFPHSKLDLAMCPTKKQTTRMVKCECPTCGYVCRTTKKWLLIGVPHCPTHGAMETDDSGEDLQFNTPDGEPDER